MKPKIRLFFAQYGQGTKVAAGHWIVVLQKIREPLPNAESVGKP